MAKFGIALEWGSRGPEFESQHSDQTEYPSGYSVFYFQNCSVIVVRKRAVFAYFRFYVDSWGREKTHLVRITHPRRDGTGEVSFITGWMVEPGGKLRMTTPYGGKSYARNG